MNPALVNEPNKKGSTLDLRSLRRWLGGSLTPYLFVAPFFILFAAFGLYPLTHAFLLSFTRWHGVGAPEWIGTSNYTFLLSDRFFWQSITNSLVLWLMIVPGQTVLAVLVASILSRPKLRLRWLFRAIYLTPYLVPLVAIAQVWLILFDKDFGSVNALLGLLNIPPIGWMTTSEWSKPTMALLVFWKTSGFAILVMLAAMQGIPVEIYESAALDGANGRQQFLRITVPLLRRAIGFYVVISTLGVVQMFAEPYVLTEGGPYNSTTTAGYSLLQYIRHLDFGTGAANSFLLMVLVLVLSLGLLRVLRMQDEG